MKVLKVIINLNNIKIFLKSQLEIQINMIIKTLQVQTPLILILKLIVKIIKVNHKKNFSHRCLKSNKNFHFPN